MDTSGAALTCSVAVALTSPSVAVIVTLPNPVVVATPVLLIVAIALLEEVQLTESVKNLVVPSS
jgi:hypothetical protein